MITHTPMLDRKELRHFGLMMGIIIIVLFGLLLPWLLEHSLPVWPWIVAGIFWTGSLLYPKSLWPVYRVWMVFGHVLGQINTRIILGIIFFVVIFPMGFVMRFFGYDPMRLKIDKKIETYRVGSLTKNKKHVEKPF